MSSNELFTNTTSNFHSWTARYCFDSVFLYIETSDLPIFTYCKQLLLAHHILWNCLNKKIIYFTKGVAEDEDSTNTGIVILSCIRTGCPYNLVCKRGTLNFKSKVFEYYYVDSFVNHTCSPISLTEKSSLRRLSECWDDKTITIFEQPHSSHQHSISSKSPNRTEPGKAVPNYIGDNPKTGLKGYSRHDAVQRLLDNHSGHNDNHDFLENTKIFQDISNDFKGFKISDFTVTNLKFPIPACFLHVINPKLLNSDESSFKTITSSFLKLFSFHPQASSPENLEKRVRWLLEKREFDLANSRSLIYAISTFLSLRKPGSTFFACYNPVTQPALENSNSTSKIKQEKLLTKKKSLEPIKTEKPTLSTKNSDLSKLYCFESNSESEPDLDTISELSSDDDDDDEIQVIECRARGASQYKKLRLNNSSMKSVNILQTGICFVETKPSNSYDTYLYPIALPKIKNNDLDIDKRQFDFNERIQSTSTFKAPNINFDNLIRLIETDFDIPSEKILQDTNSIQKENFLRLFSSLKYPEDNKESYQNYYADLAQLLTNNELVDQLLKRATFLKSHGKRYIDSIGSFSQCHDYETEQLSSHTSSSDEIISSASDSPASTIGEEDEEEEDISNTSQQVSPPVNNRKNNVTKEFTKASYLSSNIASISSSEISTNYMEKLFDEVENLVEKKLLSADSNRENYTYCEKANCIKSYSVNDSGLKDALGNRHKNADSEVESQLSTPRYCGELSHIISDMIITIFRGFPVNPIELEKKISSWFTAHAIKNFNKIFDQGIPYVCNEVFYAPEISKDIISLVNPIISIDSTFLKKENFGEHIMYVATGITPQLTVINLGIGIYSAKSYDHYSSFLNKLCKAHKECFEKYCPSVIFSGNESFFKAIIKARSDIPHYICAQSLAESCKKLQFTDSSAKDKFLSVFHKILCFTDRTEIAKLHKEMLRILENVKIPTKRDGISKDLSDAQKANDYTIEIVTYIKDINKFCYAYSEFPRYNQIVANKIKKYNMPLLNLMEKNLWSIIVEFEKLTHAQVLEEKTKFYKNRIWATFINDDTILIPQICSSISYSLLRLHEYYCKHVENESYIITPRSESPFSLLMNQARTIPSEFPGLYESLHGTVSVSTKSIRAIRMNDSYSRKTHLVDLLNKTCTCNYFQQLEYPCLHALKVIMEKGYKISDYCSERYQLDMVLPIFEKYKSFDTDNQQQFTISELLHIESQLQNVKFGQDTAEDNTNAN